eukprot:gene6291-2924_t
MAERAVVAIQDTPDPVKHPSGIVPQLQNVVATVNLGCRLDLKEIALHARNAEYNPKRFAAVIMRIREPKTTALIFASGKMYAKIVQKLGFAATFKRLKVQNIVGSCNAAAAPTPIQPTPSPPPSSPRSYVFPTSQYAKIVQKLGFTATFKDSKIQNIKLGFAATFKEFKIQNIVGSCDVRFPIRLEGLAIRTA